MVVEIKGQQLRIRVRDPKLFLKFRTQDVGKKGGLMRLAGYRKGIGWITQAWRMNLNDFTVDQAVQILRTLRIPTTTKRRAISKAVDYYQKKLSRSISRYIEK